MNFEPAFSNPTQQTAGLSSFGGHRSPTKTKLLFLLLFVPVHAFLSLTMLGRGYNLPAGGNSAVFQFFSAVLMSPLLLPLVMLDPDGERLPKWIQFVSVPLNSFIWAMGLLFVVCVIKRWRASHGHA